MPERKRLVMLDALVPGAPTTLKDLDDGTNYASVRGSFQVKQGQRRQSVAQRSTRYGGGLVASESSENDTVTWKALVKGSTADAVLANAESMLTLTELPRSDVFVEWRPDGASKSSYYRVMGPAAFDLTYEWGQFAGSRSMYVDVSFPVEPLALGDMVIRQLPFGTMPSSLTRLPNPSFEHGSGSSGVFGWKCVTSAASASVSRYSGWAASGSYSALVSGTVTQATGNMTVELNGNETTLMTVVPGSSYTATARARCITALSGAVAYIVFAFYDAFGNLISYAGGGSVSVASTGDKGTLSCTGTAPAGACYATVILNSIAGSTTGSLGVAWDDVAWSGGVTVPGTAPGLADFQVQMFYPSAMPAWALLGWHPKIGAPASGLAQPPFGLLPAADAVLSGMAAALDGNFRGDRGARVSGSTASAGTSSVRWPVLSSLMTPDDFTRGTIDVEVWGRLELSGGLVSPKVQLSTVPNSYYTGPGGQVQYSAEYGGGGKLLTVPSSGSAYRMVKFGTVTLPTDVRAPQQWLVATLSWAAGGSGTFGVDYIMCVPARSRMVYPTGLALDSSYPRFMPSSSAYTTKLVRSDLSGGLAEGGYTPPFFNADTSAGGSPIELPAGEVDVFVAMDSQVPDDPSSNAASSSDGMQWFVDLAGPRFYITPRYFLTAS